ncbi:MAG: hypothetical protein WC763_00015 [Candidatus Paceibacterota bacterium]|jgi:hypothetical protein
MNKTAGYIIAAGGLLSASLFMFDFSGVSDAELKQYIQDSLARGCRPIIDVCTSDCGSAEPQQNVTEECIIPSGDIIKVSYTRAQNGYVKLAQDLGISATNTSPLELPDRIREKLEDSGVSVEPQKESFVITD